MPERVDAGTGMVEELKPRGALGSTIGRGEVDARREPIQPTKTHVPMGLSFQSGRSFGSYPDTAESGQTYDMEAAFPPKRTPVVAPIGEYSE